MRWVVNYFLSSVHSLQMLIDGVGDQGERRTRVELGQDTCIRPVYYEYALTGPFESPRSDRYSPSSACGSAEEGWTECGDCYGMCFLLPAIRITNYRLHRRVPLCRC